jgi:putative oxidoreductase
MSIHIVQVIYVHIVPVLLGLAFVLIGCLTLVGQKKIVENFRRFGYPQWFRKVIGILEALGGAGLLIGIWMPFLAGLASAGLVLVMLGAIASHLRARDSFKHLAPAIVMCLQVIIILVAHAPALGLILGRL